jgi:16S rRNA (cytosine967-C5)-methyltransferase
MGRSRRARDRSARDVVSDRVAARARRFPDILPQPLAMEGLDRRDSALAYAIDHAVARRWLTLAAVASPHLRRPWEALAPAVQAALLAGSAQLLLLDRLPDHAVINEAVGWTGRHAPPGSARLVNAVLRRIAGCRGVRIDLRGRRAPYEPDELPLDDGQGWKLASRAFDDDPLVRLAQQTSHPVALLARWTDRFGRPATADLAVHDLVHAPIILAGLSGGTDASTGAASPGVSAGPPASGPGLEVHRTPGFTVFRGAREELTALLRRNPSARVQDPSSAAPVAATAALSPTVIVEPCAGKGTKTRQLAELHPRARIVASDARAQKLQMLRRATASCGTVEVLEARRLAELAGRADLVVADVPCSNSGVLARRVEAKYRFGPQTLDALVDLQRQILADSLRLLADGGRLMYCTCSLEEEENERQVQWLTRWHPLTVERQERHWPASLPGDSPSTYRDGGYFALLRKRP